MKTITSLSVVADLKLSLSFDDGAQGVIDLSCEPLTGVFERWTDPAFFRQVAIGERGRTLVWPNEIDLCADSLWLEITGNPPEALYSGVNPVSYHA